MEELDREEFFAYVKRADRGMVFVVFYPPEWVHEAFPVGEQSRVVDEVEKTARRIPSIRRYSRIGMYSFFAFSDLDRERLFSRVAEMHGDGVQGLGCPRVGFVSGSKGFPAELVVKLEGGSHEAARADRDAWLFEMADDLWVRPVRPTSPELKKKRL